MQKEVGGGFKFLFQHFFPKKLIDLIRCIDTKHKTNKKEKNIDVILLPALLPSLTLKLFVCSVFVKRWGVFGGYFEDFSAFGLIYSIGGFEHHPAPKIR